jgi:hypothetical protein
MSIIVLHAYRPKKTLSSVPLLSIALYLFNHALFKKADGYIPFIGFGRCCNKFNKAQQL